MVLIMNFKERFKKARIAKGYNQEELAEIVGVSQTAVNKIETGKTISPRNILDYAKALEVSPDFLLNGVVSSGDNINEPLNANYINNKIPLISWVKAGSWSPVIDNFQPGDAEDFYPCPEKTSGSTFALKVTGESMSPTYENGEIIFVDPEVMPINGSDVVVRQNGDSEATFKRLILDGDKMFLKALNPNCPTPIMEMLSDAHICGVVVGSYRKR